MFTKEICIDECVKPFVLYKNGKSRTIYSYSDNKEGKKLRKEHEKLLYPLSKYKSSKHSYAYKKGYCTKDAVEPHINSNLFIKIDIHSFFESITEDLFYKNLEIQSQSEKNKELIHTCFYEGHLPLGFVTSPILSDIFMKNFDARMEEYLSAHPSLRYSRYCDDMLISTKDDNFGELDTFYYFIESELKKINLSINNKKVRKVDLEKNGSVSFLGLNISRKNEIPQITISKTFILKTLDLLEKYYSYDVGRANLKSYKHLRVKIRSRVSYIEYNSVVSYNKFLIKHKNKFGKAYNRELPLRK